MKKKYEPTQLKVTNGQKAWMYVNPKSIEIYVWVEGFPTLSCKITEKQLKKLLTNK